MASHHGFPSTIEVTTDVGASDTIGIVRARPTLLEDSLACEYTPDLAWDARTPGTPVGSSTHWWGLAAHSFGDEQIFERIWLVPVMLDFGFIAEAVSDTFEIWNAFTMRTIQVTSSVLSGETDGITIDLPTTPYYLAPFGLTIATISLSLEGPSQQDSTYTLVIDGVTYTVDVLGIRVMSAVPDPNWRRQVVMRYAYNTIIYQNPYFVEQRRPLTPIPWRQLDAEYLVSDSVGQRLINAFAYGHDKPFVVPIYQEKLTPTLATVGTKTINVSEATADFWNLNLSSTTHVALVDHDASVIEVKEIDTIGANSITTVSAIVNTFDLASTVLYPVFFGLAHSVGIKSETDGTVAISAKFREYRDG